MKEKNEKGYDMAIEWGSEHIDHLICIILITMIVVVGAAFFSGCSSTTYVDENTGEEISVNKGDILFETSGNFTITKVDRGSYYTRGGGTQADYTVVCEKDDTTFVLQTTIKEYALWSVGDIIQGKVVSEYGNFAPCITFHLDEETKFDVIWYGNEKTK